MNQQCVKTIERIKPFFLESTAKELVEKRKKPGFLHKQTTWISSIPLYLPFWFVEVEMELISPKRGMPHVKRVYTIMVNAITNRGMLVKGLLETEQIQTKAVFMTQEVPAEEARETARIEALFDTKRMMKPPPHRVLPGERLVYYPLALVKLNTNGKEEVQVYDYYHGGIDRYTMRFFRMKENLEQKKQVQET